MIKTKKEFRGFYKKKTILKLDQRKLDEGINEKCDHDNKFNCSFEKKISVLYALLRKILISN